MNEHSPTHEVSFQGLTFRYTERETLLIIMGGNQYKELNPREAADLLTYLTTHQGDLFKNASEGNMSTWPQTEHGIQGKTEIARDILDSYEKKNAYAEHNEGNHPSREEHTEEH